MFRPTPGSWAEVHALEEQQSVRPVLALATHASTSCRRRLHHTIRAVPYSGMLSWLQVSRSVEYVQSGTVALQDAKSLQKKTRKWMCCAIILLLVTAAVIVIVVRLWAKCSCMILVVHAGRDSANGLHSAPG